MLGLGLGLVDLGLVITSTCRFRFSNYSRFREYNVGTLMQLVMYVRIYVPVSTQYSIIYPVYITVYYILYHSYFMLIMITVNRFSNNTKYALYRCCLVFSVS